MSPARLARFFLKEDARYRVMRELREAVVFTAQNLLADAPFSRLDLISCRNLLIYLSPEAQEKILSLFHFALRESGMLFLGSPKRSAVSAISSSRSAKKHRIYRHLGRSRPGEVDFPISCRRSGRLSPTRGRDRRRSPPGLGDLVAADACWTPMRRPRS